MVIDVRKLRYADVIARVLKMRDECDAMLELLVPDGDEAPSCPHPADKIEVLGDMGDPETYHCTLCGAHQPTPFLSLED